MSNRFDADHVSVALRLTLEQTNTRFLVKSSNMGRKFFVGGGYSEASDSDNLNGTWSLIKCPLATIVYRRKFQDERNDRLPQGYL